MGKATLSEDFWVHQKYPNPLYNLDEITQTKGLFSFKKACVSFTKACATFTKACVPFNRPNFNLSERGWWWVGPAPAARKCTYLTPPPYWMELQQGG